MNEMFGLVVGGVLLTWLIYELVVNQLMNARLRRFAPLPSDVPPVIDELNNEYLQGNMRPALLEALRKVASNLSPETTNLAVCLDVAAGRYAQALLWRDLCPKLKLRDEYELLIRINEAEALANLGRIEEALVWVDRAAVLPLTKSGAACHRAWCLALLSRTQEAEAALAAARPDDLGLLYASEYFLAASAISLGAGRWAEAGDALRSAEKRAFRASTKRNIHFGRGLLFAAQGLHLDALIHFEKGALATYASQGGAALLAWGDSLHALGRGDEARRAWTLCAERDPQSPAAGRAKGRLDSAFSNGSFSVRSAP